MFSFHFCVKLALVRGQLYEVDTDAGVAACTGVTFITDYSSKLLRKLKQLRTLSIEFLKLCQKLNIVLLMRI